MHAYGLQMISVLHTWRSKFGMHFLYPMHATCLIHLILDLLALLIFNGTVQFMNSS